MVAIDVSVPGVRSADRRNRHDEAADPLDAGRLVRRPVDAPRLRAGAAGVPLGQLGRPCKDATMAKAMTAGVADLGLVENVIAGISSGTSSTAVHFATLVNLN